MNFVLFATGLQTRLGDGGSQVESPNASEMDVCFACQKHAQHVNPTSLNSEVTSEFLKFRISEVGSCSGGDFLTKQVGILNFSEVQKRFRISEVGPVSEVTSEISEVGLFGTCMMDCCVCNCGSARQQLCNYKFAFQI